MLMANKIDAISTTAIKVIMAILCFTTLYPFIYCLAYSFSNSISVMTKVVTVYPIDFTLKNYEVVFKNRIILNSFFISVSRTVSGVIYALVVTGFAAFAMSKRDLPGNRLLGIFFIIPMYVSGGLLPYYVLISKLGLFNNFLVYIIPQGIWTFNLLIMRTYFESLPDSLEESAKIDGASDLMIFAKIITPISMPIVATVVMFVGVWQWNSWFDAMLFVSNIDLIPMQSMLQKLLLESFSADLQAQAKLAQGIKQTSPESLKMAAVIVTTVPIVIIYPFMQRYFIKGMMIGAVKA